MTLHNSSSRNECRRILLVEDETFVRDATRRILQNAGFEVLPAADAQEAFAACERSGQDIDLLMTDIVLPGRSGLQLLEDFQLRSPRTLILLTSGYGESIGEHDLSESTAHYLPKPYSRQSLLEKIEQIFSARSSALSRPRRRANVAGTILPT